HLASCTLCRSHLIDYKQSSSAVIASLQKSFKSSRIKPLEHISYGMLEDYVNGKSDRFDREIVEEHIKVCRQCAWELDDLQSFARKLQQNSESHKSNVGLNDLVASESTTHSQTRSAPQATLGNVAYRPTEAQPPWWRRISNFLAIPAAWSGLQIASAAALAVIVVAGSFVVIAVRLNMTSSPQTGVARGIQPQDKVTPSSSGPNGDDNKPSSPPEIPKAPENPTTHNTIATVVLLPSVARGGPSDNKLVISKETTAVHLQVKVESGEYQKYKAVLRSASGNRSINLGPAPLAKSGRVLFTVPANQLENGGYLLILAGIDNHGNEENAGNYPFEVIKK